ncbi:MAG TPA: DUF5522 domain-containing protein [Pyrinomonadaceae bacterium]|nr:DUF5522 domain-containing protein [Pyrinomonadaceae bacterium]
METKQTTKQPQEKLIEGVDYYFENGLMVLTAHFLLKRGYCCRNGCRHCPYSLKDEKNSLE